MNFQTRKYTTGDLLFITEITVSHCYFATSSVFTCDHYPYLICWSNVPIFHLLFEVWFQSFNFPSFHFFKDSVSTRSLSIHSSLTVSASAAAPCIIRHGKLSQGESFPPTPAALDPADDTPAFQSSIFQILNFNLFIFLFEGVIFLFCIWIILRGALCPWNYLPLTFLPTDRFEKWFLKSWKIAFRGNSNMNTWRAEEFK